ncbi:MAG: ABC transporter ATP-binding protein [Deltaproteobacteria bacterium]|nr:ABC transporter ATP-binding protein [Deltaproteobacteria bacterium]
MLRLKNFTFTIDGRTILDRLDFTAPEGIYLSIIGPNGAGKSTLLKCLLRLHERGRTRGEIEIQGRPLSEYGQKDLARTLAYVPQAGGWIPPFTVRELLCLSRYPYMPLTGGFSAADRLAVEKALELAELTALADRPLRALSGGERQRAFMAAALAQETPVMLLDEPASFLDPKHAADLKALLKKLHQEEGLSLITVTHDLNHPLDAGGLALVLREGRQLFFGPPEELLRNGVLEEAYQHKFTCFTHPRSGRPAILD